MSFRSWRVRLLPSAALCGLLTLLSIQTSGGRMQAQGGCGPTVNAIVCENLNPGNPASEWDISGRRRHHHPGFPDQYQHRARTTHLLQDQHNRQRLLDQHLSHGLLRRHGRPQGRDHLAVGVAAAESARLLDAGGDGPDRLRKLGRLRIVDRARTPYPGSTSRDWRATTTAAPATSCSSSATTRAHRRRGLPDLRHHVAGLQPLRRQQPVHGRPRHQRRSRLQSQLQPADHARVRCPAARTTCSTPSTRWCAGWRPTATTSVTSAASTSIAG